MTLDYSPCGEVFGVLRTPFDAPARFYTDDPAGGYIRWFFAAPGARVFAGRTPFHPFGRWPGTVRLAAGQTGELATPQRLYKLNERPAIADGAHGRAGALTRFEGTDARPAGPLVIPACNLERDFPTTPGGGRMDGNAVPDSHTYFPHGGMLMGGLAGVVSPATVEAGGMRAGGNEGYFEWLGTEPRWRLTAGGFKMDGEAFGVPLQPAAGGGAMDGAALGLGTYAPVATGGGEMDGDTFATYIAPIAIEGAGGKGDGDGDVSLSYATTVLQIAAVNSRVNNNLVAFFVEPFSVAFWFKPANLTGTAWMVSQRATGGNGWKLGRNGAVPQFQGTGAGLYPFTGHTLTVSVWQHVALVVAGGTATCYINGVPVSVAETPSSPSVRALMVGDTNGVASAFGLYHGFAAWLVALTGSDVASLATGTVDPLTLSPKVLWAFVDGASPTADTSGGGFNGTLTNSPLFVVEASVPFGQ